MGAELSHNGPQTKSCDKFEVFGVVQPQTGRDFALISPKHTDDQVALETVSLFRQIGAKKDKVVRSSNRVMLTVF